MARKLSTSTVLNRMHSDLTWGQIADALGFSESSVRRVAAGKQSDRNMAEVARELYDCGKRKRAAACAREFDLEHRKGAPPPPTEPEAPLRIQVWVTGDIGPYNEREYMRVRTLGNANPLILEGVNARGFLKAIEAGNELRAANFAAAEYFPSHPGYVKSVDEINYEIL
jgi:hypothetical protein